MNSSRSAFATTTSTIKCRRWPLGLIAEEVAEVNPDLVGRNREGQPESVRYEQINAMLLNEFFKEHWKNEEQEATIARQQNRLTRLLRACRR
jgi:hypothetical protein